jgi:hypothetical protein
MKPLKEAKMASPRLCPHCNIKLPIDRNFSFDEKLNLICGYCGKIVFPTDIDSEKDAFVPKKQEQKQSFLNSKNPAYRESDEK